ncbi:MAG: hypothetical protein KDI71_21975, partial [Xanthomonadales bacterium]|nr:hypothetical protein [Xanthomonadales bacterium]
MENDSAVRALPGVHRFQVIGRIDNMSNEVIFSPFLFRPTSDQNPVPAEIDIEFGRSSNTICNSPPSNAQFIVQPFSSGPCTRYANPFDFVLTGADNEAFSSYLIDWRPSQSEVFFAGWYGHSSTPVPLNYIGPEGGWTFVSNANALVPSASVPLKTIIQIWIDGNGDATREHDVVIRQYSGPINTAGLRRLDVTSVGPGRVVSDRLGIDCPSDCVEHYTDVEVETVRLIATPQSGFEFLGWSGSGCAGSSSVCDLPMNGARSITATFGEPPVLHVLTIAGGGTG